MANILLLDDSDVAGRAMRGILGRADHRCLIATAGGDAWRQLREGVVIDLLFLELKAGGDTGGLAFLERLRQDPFWQELPVVVYTSSTEPRDVRRALALGIQNYLVKPYNDEAVFGEVAKARLDAWRSRHFEDPAAFCARTGIPGDQLPRLRRQVMKTYDEAAKMFPAWATAREPADVLQKLDTLQGELGAAGMSVGLDYLAGLRAQAEQENWAAFKDCAPVLDFAARLIFCHMNPGYVPEVLKPQADADEGRPAAEYARWAEANVEAAPVLTEAAIQKEASALSGCPAIHSAAAAFVMAADGHASSLTRVMELVREDPGLCAQVLIAANRLEHDELTPIEDPNAAVTLLGEIRLNTLAKSTLTIEERYLRAPPLTWVNYWMYLVGVAKLSRFICDYLEFQYLSPSAYTAGLLHDIGKLLLLRLHPAAFSVIAAYARERRMLLHVAEQKFIGCTTRSLAVGFAEQQKLPAIYVDVIRWVDAPETATDNVELVAMVALARHVCLHNRVGHCGDTPGDSCPPIVTTKAWEVLQPRLFPSFDLRKFEAQAHAFCRDMRLALLGQSSPVLVRAAAGGTEQGREVAGLR